MFDSIVRNVWPNWGLWLALAVIGLVDLVWLVASGHKVLISEIFAFALPVAILGAFTASKLIKEQRLRAAVVGGYFVVVAWPVLRLFNHLMMTTDLPLQDNLLASWVAVLGFHWIGYVRWLDENETLLGGLAACYSNLSVVSCLAFLAIVSAGDLIAAGDFLVLFVAGAVITSAVGAFFPASGATIYYAPESGMLLHIPTDVGTWFVAPLNDVRNNSAHIFDISNLPGLTAFPSFHTEMGLIVLYCCRTRACLFVAAAVYVPMMVAAAAVFGGHYFVDLIAGATMTLGLIMGLRLTRRRLNFLQHIRTATAAPSFSAEGAGAHNP
jgi:hypothetical protein